MPSISMRPARIADARTIAELYRLSSDGVADYIWQGNAAPGEDILTVGQRRYEREDSVFSYRSATIVESDSDIAAMLVAFPMTVEEGAAPADPVLAPYSTLEEPDSYYICAMAVFEQFRNLGIGSSLLERAELDAREAGLNKLSLIVFEQNTGAKKLYARHGYVEVKRAAVVPHALIHFEGDALLMVKCL